VRLMRDAILVPPLALAARRSRSTQQPLSLALALPSSVSPLPVYHKNCRK